MRPKKEKLLVFTMSSDQALEFWRRVMERGAETEAERKEILLEMANEGKVESVSETGRTKEEYIQDMSKEFRVLDVRSLDDKPGEKNA